MSLVSVIPVRDANGDQISVYEFQEWRFLQKVRCFKLDTDERVEQLDENTFVLASGEKLTRVAD